MIRAAIMAVILPFYVSQTISVADMPEIREEPEQIQQEEIVEEAPSMEYVGDYRVTAFNYEEGDGENYYTASGAEPVPYYTVATGDEFPFGTVLYIEGLGYAEVQDRGGFGPGIIDYHIGDDPTSSFDDRMRAVYVVNP